MYREARPDALGPPLGDLPRRLRRLCWCEHPDTLVDREQAQNAQRLLSCEGSLERCELPPETAEDFVASLRARP